MDEKGRKEFMDEFKKGDGTKRLDLWDYAIQQQVLWEKIITELQNIARDQGIDKELEKMMDEDLKQLEA
jgi:hypothetical protein